MRINQKLYVIADGKEPVEKQKFNDREVEIFFMDQFEGLVEEYVHSKGQFAVWASLDAVNYRLFIERGYYEEVSELYQQPVNQIWIEFWDKTEEISRKFTRIFIYPMMLIAVVLCVLSFVLPKALSWGLTESNIFSYCIIGGLVALFIVMIVTNSYTKKKITEENIKSRQKVMDIFGEEGFNASIDKQKNYMDDYFKKLYPEEESDEALEENAQDNATETVEDENNNVENENDATVEESKEEVVETTTDEVKEEVQE